MANRFQTNERTWVYRYLCLRDGEHCLKCGKKPPRYALQIDHADENPQNNDAQNLSLLCESCNQLMRKMRGSNHRRSILNYRAKNERERERGREGEKSGRATEVNKRVFDYASGSVEMKLSGVLEPKYREWIIAYLNAYGSIRRKEAMNGGAEAVGMSPTTASRYLDKLMSDMGILDESMDSLGHRVLTLKAEILSRYKPTKALPQPTGCQKKPINSSKAPNGRTGTKKAVETEKRETQ